MGSPYRVVHVHTGTYKHWALDFNVHHADKKKPASWTNLGWFQTRDKACEARNQHAAKHAIY